MIYAHGNGGGMATAQVRAPASDVAEAFTGVFARFHTLGLNADEFAALRARYLSDADEPPDLSPCDPIRADEHGDLVELLLAHRHDDGQETRWLAAAMATACLGDNHLWQDMGLSGREALSALIRQHFPTLHAKNVGNMKWKKFFYKELCHKAEVSVCKAPSCRVCADYALCFGPE
ncbi:MAG TPA: nitrogen fixation protein NifQ [Acidiferrobacter sp.]|nr:nitrogen fixation protein NifQ [Acidiferrobacter sp.]